MIAHQLSSSSRLCQHDGQAASRALALAEIDQHLANLKRCIHWLVASGVSILAADMNRGQTMPHITIAASSWLHILFRDDCADVGQRQEGALKIVPWIAVRHGCVIRWEEVSA